MLGAQAYNNSFMSLSDLIAPLGQCAVYDLQQNALDPYGMKPFGWAWVASTQVYEGEVCTPPITGGNGHTYVCTQRGITGPTPPTFSTNDGGTFSDGPTVAWKEQTAVFANALSSPPIPVLTPTTGGAFPTGSDVYIEL